MIDLTEIILAVIAVLGTILTAVVVPLLKQKLTENQQEILGKIVKTGVYAAEQLFGGGTGAQKKEWVLKYLSDQGYNVDLESINAQIEAVVKELKIAANC